MAGLFGYGNAIVDFYHYTSETNADMIIDSGVIMESLNGGADAMLGRGKVSHRFIFSNVSGSAIVMPSYHFVLCCCCCG